MTADATDAPPMTGTDARTIRIGTRASLLARTQTDIVASALTDAGATVEVVTISTDGDRSQAAGTPIAMDGVGVFVTALRDALLADEIDVAVHSYKDLPTAGGAGADAGRRAGARGPARRPRGPRRDGARGAAARRGGRHRLAAAGRPDPRARARPRARADPGQRRHPDRAR